MIARMFNLPADNVFTPVAIFLIWLNIAIFIICVCIFFLEIWVHILKLRILRETRTNVIQSHNILKVIKEWVSLIKSWIEEARDHRQNTLERISEVTETVQKQAEEIKKVVQDVKDVSVSINLPDLPPNHV